MNRVDVDELFDIIARAEAELQALRLACPHPSYSVGLWSAHRLGSIIPARICTECRSRTGDPDEAEIRTLEGRK